MILFQLRCPSDHEFEGWFPSGAGYEAQRDAGEIACPVCGDVHIDKAPMAPAVAKTRSAPAMNPMQMLRALRRVVESNCENVGDRFAEEARKIHNGESDARGIYGDTTPEEAEQLAEDGIEVARIPWVPATDS